MSGFDAAVMLAYWREHREQMRQSENQRAALTNYILVIVAALTGFLVQQGFKPVTWPLPVLIIVVGVYGAVTAAKYHERADYHLTQARTLTTILVEYDALPDSRARLDAARRTHAAAYPHLHRIRLHHLWTCLHVVIAAYGVTLLMITITR